MPFDSNDSLPEGVKGLPEGQQTKWRETFNGAYEGTCKDQKDRDKCASRIAWSQIEDKYKGKSGLVEFSLVIKASQDPETKEMRWKMSASDIDTDSFGDNMSYDLYQDFIRRIDMQELAPEQFRSDFWQGGMPYLSISHYPDLNGAAVPGIVETTYIDGDCKKACFKSKGKFNDTPIGIAAFKAVEDNPNKPEDKKVRVSIGFLDWAHIHKNNSNYKFIREDIDDICPECLKEMIKGKSEGKIYLAGQLVHLALTRVPANKRTEMEVDRSMTTMKEDAESIIGEELAEEIEKKAKLTNKSEALVIKAEKEKCPDYMDKEECRKWQEERKRENGEDGEDTGQRGGDKPHDRGQDGGKNTIVAAPTSRPSKSEAEDDCDCNDPANAEVEKCKGKKKEKSDFEELKADILEIKSMLKPAPTPEPTPHVLDAAINKLKSDFDEAITINNLDVEDKLKLLQDSFNGLAEVAREKISISAIPVQETPQAEQQTNVPDIVQAFSEALKPLQQQLGLLSAQIGDLKKSNVVEQPVVPDRKSFNPQLIQQQQRVVKSETPKLRALIERTT